MANLAPANALATLRLGTRTSQLALWQTNFVVTQLQAHWPQLQCQLVHMVTQGDKRLDRPLPEIGGKGLFTAELEDALRHGEIDLAVHSLKDLPVESPPDLIIGAILSREDTRDVVVAREGWTLATLPKGAVVGTSSLRRQAQLLAIRPDLEVRSIRGNVDTRLRKVLNGEYHAAVMAGAGLLRLGLTEHITEWIEPDIILPAPGQGALAVQCRADDAAVQTLLAAIHDAQAEATTTAERQLLLALGGGCSAPIGAWARVNDDLIELYARVASVDGSRVFDASSADSDPYTVAQRTAQALLRQGAQVALEREAPTMPLAGKRVVITRPRESATGQGDLAQLLREQEAVPIEVPAIRLVPTADTSVLEKALHQLPSYTWIIFTSAHAIDFFWAHIADKVSIQHWPKVAAIGSATQKALQAHGLTVQAMPEEYKGSAIAATLGELQGASILLPRSAKGGRELPDSLTALGAVVYDIALYEPVPAPISKEEMGLLAAGVDVVTFASGSAVRSLVNSLRGDARFANFWSTVTVACIGPTTAEVARAEGLPVHIVADDHSVQGLIAALVAYYEQGA